MLCKVDFQRSIVYKFHAVPWRDSDSEYCFLNIHQCLINNKILIYRHRKFDEQIYYIFMQSFLCSTVRYIRLYMNLIFSIITIKSITKIYQQEKNKIIYSITMKPLLVCNELLFLTIVAYCTIIQCSDAAISNVRMTTRKTESGKYFVYKNFAGGFKNTLILFC